MINALCSIAGHDINKAEKIGKREEKMSEKIVQTAGREQLGAFAPEFAHFNDDVLFGENWNNPDIDVKTRSIRIVPIFSE